VLVVPTSRVQTDASVRNGNVAMVPRRSDELLLSEHMTAPPQYRRSGASCPQSVETRLRDSSISHNGVGVEVRRISPRDADRLKQLRLAALEEAPWAFGSTYVLEADRPHAEWVQRAVAGSRGSDRATFFAQLDDEFVGLVGGHREEPSSPTVELVSMWVAPHVRGRGVGAVLVDAVKAWATDTNATTITLWVTRGNTPAERLYRSQGFVATGEVKPLPSDSSLDESRMELSLR
jgi:GNAT superfamily N-acetyltransferase